MVSGWVMCKHTKNFFKKAEFISLKAEMECHARNIISLNARKRGNARRTGGLMSNLEIIKRQINK